MAVREFGRLDILDNNAALTEPTQFAKDQAVADMELDTWERVMASNLRGLMLGCKHAIPVMREQGGGSIVNMSSGSSQLGDFQLSAYAASKAGLHALTRSVATQYGRDGIRANTIVPGLILTPAADTNLAPEKRAMLASNILLPYFGEPVDVGLPRALPGVRRSALPHRPGVRDQRRPDRAPAHLRAGARATRAGRVSARYGRLASCDEPVRFQLAPR